MSGVNVHQDGSVTVIRSLPGFGAYVHISLSDDEVAKIRATAPAPTAPTPSAIPARLLSGEHVGREVVLPDGTTGQITATPCVRLDLWNSSTGEGNPLKIRHIGPDDVVTLVDGSDS